MSNHIRPELGSTQPVSRYKFLVNSNAMIVKRNQVLPGRARDILASNLIRFMEREYKGVWERRGEPTRMIAEFARDSGVSETTIQSVTNPKQYNRGANIDTIERLANAMRCHAYELLKLPETTD